MRKIFMASMVLLFNLLLPISAFAYEEDVTVGTTIRVEKDGISYAISDESVARVIVDDNGRPAVEFIHPGDVTVLIIEKVPGKVFTDKWTYHVRESETSQSVAPKSDIVVGATVVYELDGVSADSFTISDESVAQVVDDNGKLGVKFLRPGEVTVVVYYKADGEESSEEHIYHVVEPEESESFGSSGSFNANTSVATVSVQELAQEVLRLVNEERAKVGARPLVLDRELMDGCAIRARELTELYSHTRPNGRDCFTVLRHHNAYQAENIAAGQSSPVEVMESWMNSPGHRANILNKNFTKLGVGYYYSDSGYSFYWVQLFMGKDLY